MPNAQLPRRHLLLLVTLCLAFRTALAYHVVRSFQSEGISATFGYFAFPIVLAEAILLCTGAEAIVPTRLRWIVMPFVTVRFSALDFFGTQFYLLPYYGGLTTSLPTGSIPAMHLSALKGIELETLISRLALNKPMFLGATVLATLWALSIIALIGLILLSLAVGRRRRRFVAFCRAMS
jgi:hypothetical protein